MRTTTLVKLRAAVTLFAPDAPELLKELEDALDQLERGLERFCAEETCTRGQNHDGRCGTAFTIGPRQGAQACGRRRADCGDWDRPR